MTTENRIYKLQEEYFEFCLGLLQKIPTGEIHLETFSRKAYQLKNQLRDEIKANLKNFKTEAIREVEEEIEKLRKLLNA